MNILEQLKAARLQAIRRRLATETIVVRKHARWVNVEKYRTKDQTVWCPHCQQWTYPWIGTACWRCHLEIPELREKWERKKAGRK